MNKTKKLISAFLGLIISITLASNLICAEETNAALLYQDGVSLLEKLFSTVKGKIEKIIQEGWRTDNQDVKEYLVRNEKAINKFKEASKLNYCDFTSGKEIKNTIESEIPKYGEMVKLAKLTIVEARLFEKEGKLDAALDNYLAVLRFISHLEQQKRFVLLSKLVGMRVQKLLFKPLSCYINQNKLSREIYHTLLSVLIFLRNNETGLKSAFKEEKENMRDMKKMFMVQAKERGLHNQEFYQKFCSEFDKLVDEFYGYLITAFEENNPRYYEEKITQFRKKLEKETKPLNLAQDILRAGISKNAPSLSAKILVSLYMPSFFKAITKYYVSLAELNILITASAIKLYEMDEGRLPDRLEDLVPKYIPQVFKDPFNNFKPLTYRKTKKGWIIYSFGPDKKDDLGKVEYDYKKLTKGDIMFSSF